LADFVTIEMRPPRWHCKAPNAIHLTHFPNTCFPVVQQHARTGRQQSQQQRRYRTPSEHDASHQQQQQQQQQQQEQPADDGAVKKDIRYVGGSIPSHSFRMLQQSIGIDSDAAAQQPGISNISYVTLKRN
jgi:hypothetical protein